MAQDRKSGYGTLVLQKEQNGSGLAGSKQSSADPQKKISLTSLRGSLESTAKRHQQTRSGNTERDHGQFRNSIDLDVPTGGASVSAGVTF
jgi:hypothetical protein